MTPLSAINCNQQGAKVVHQNKKIILSFTSCNSIVSLLATHTNYVMLLMYMNKDVQTAKGYLVFEPELARNVQ